MTRKCKVVARRKTRTEFEFAIHIPSATIKKSPDGKLYYFANLNQNLGGITVSGVKLKPKMILKIYMKVSSKLLGIIQRREALSKIRKGDPIMI